jgi:hypothetical protein
LRVDPTWLFPLLALGFGLAALWRWSRTRRWAGATRTWALVALIFGAVALWLRHGT